MRVIKFSPLGETWSLLVKHFDCSETHTTPLVFILIMINLSLIALSDFNTVKQKPKSVVCMSE